MDKIDNEDLKAAATMYDDLMTGNHYRKQAEAEEWLRNRGDGGITRMIIERAY